MAVKVKVILREDIPNLGTVGDVKDVSTGYARNYLLPRNLAVPATARTLAKRETQKEKLAQDREEKLVAAQAEAKTIQETVCTVTARAGKDGKLFGSVTTADVASVFAKKGVTLDHRWIELPLSIRTTGEFTGAVRLHPQVRAAFKIVVNPVA